MSMVDALRYAEFDELRQKLLENENAMRSHWDAVKDRIQQAERRSEMNKLGASGQAAEAVRESELSGLSRRANELLDGAHAIRSRLYDLRERVLGDTPGDAETASPPKEVPRGQIAELESVLVGIGEALSDIRNHLNSLERL